ncbi:MAG TPA: glycosyltransferase family 2 protein [Candidatus Dormibacteraeota bacterium]|nr:glycosyltransferase family 2 protein [Candidatus Dormibacteraeota bacterium]
MDLSVVVPVFNEVENVEALHREIDAALAPSGLGYEVLFVDDGSSDGTFDRLAAVQARDPHVVVISLSRNFGQTAAMMAGLERTQGDDVVFMDGDRQNDPADILRMRAKRAEGFDLVAGWRIDRQDAWLSRRLPSQMANWLIGAITGVRLHDYGCSLKVMRGDLARSLRLYGEMHRFIPALIDDLGGRVVEMPVNHRPRTAGRSKYGISRTVRVILDLVTVKFLSLYATRPIHVFGVAGLVATAAGLLITGWLGFERLILGIPIGGRPIVLLGILLTVMGLQFVTMGLLAELLVRTYHESQNKPIYRIGRVLPAASDEGYGDGPRLTGPPGIAEDAK